MSQDVRTEITDGIATIIWDMPGRSMNVLSGSSIAAYTAAVAAVVKDPAVKGVIVTSAKPAFIAGADLSMLGETAGRADLTPVEKAQQVFDSTMALHRLLRLQETGGKPFVVALNGTALGGGLEIALACHARIVADDPSIRLGLPESQVGLLPGSGGTQRLSRMLGPQAALQLILEGKSLRPDEALQQKIVDAVVPRAELLDRARAWIDANPKPQQPWDRGDFKLPGGAPWTPNWVQTFMVGTAMLRGRSFGNYPAQQAILSCVYEGTQLPFDTALKVEARHFTRLLSDPVSRNMIRSLFLSKQDLDKGVRRPAAQPRAELRKVGVLGAGMMGAGIAYVSAKAGLEVVLIDRDLAAAEKGKSYSQGLVDKGVQRKQIAAAEGAALLARITPATDYAGLSDVDLVVEAVFEDRGIKAEVTKRAEAVMAKPGAVFASNTSTLPITGLAEASGRPERFIGLHFFSPVDKMNLVEIIRGQKTDDAALALSMDYVRRIGKTPIIVRDSRGFYTSRVFGTYVGEGIAMLAEGVPAAMIETVGKMTGMPMPPLALQDEVSLDLAYKIMRQTEIDLGDRFRPTPSYAVTKAMVEEHGRLGKKVGKGFYDWHGDGKKSLWPELGRLFPTKGQTLPDVEELKLRFLTIQALETARCWEEGVLTDVRDADVGAILGWGFAPWTGGPLSYIDTVGVGIFVEQCDRLAQRYGERFAPNTLLRELAAERSGFYTRFAPEKRAA